ncbi:MAG: mitochondrial fission ELM1 family protein [Maricaulaceae bacterium]
MALSPEIPQRPLHIWAVCDDRAGVRNPVLGLCEAIAARVEAQITEHRLVYQTGWTKLLDRFNAPANWAPEQRLARAGLSPPWPDLWISAAGPSLPLARAAKRLAAPRPFVVQLQDPRQSVDRFDLVIAPKHDRLEGANVVTLTGAPNRVTREALDAAALRWAADLERLPRPRAAVLLGGHSKRHRMGRRTGARVIDAVTALAAQGVSLMISTSRRTPGHVVEALRARLGANPTGRLWTGAQDGDNPYLGFLAVADAVAVTTDSANLLTEAASAAKPVLMLALPGEPGKLERLYADLRAQGLARDFSGRFETWPSPGLSETDRAADTVLDRFAADRSHNANLD